MDNDVKPAGGAQTCSYRVLLAGYGAFGRVHACAWRGLRQTARLVIADPSPNARQQAAQDHPQAQVVADWREALSDADIVDIVCPADLHAGMAMAALDAGKDVFIEKPATATRAEAEAVWGRAQASGGRLAVGYILRQHPVAKAARRMLARCGRLHTVEADFVALKRPRTDVGVLLNDAIHFLDLLAWMLGGHPVEVSAVLGDHLGRGMDDRALLLMRWPGDVLVRLTASCLIAGAQPDPFGTTLGSEKRLAFSGDLGRLEADLLAGTLTFRGCRLERACGPPGLVDAPPQTERIAQLSVDDLVAAELADFCAALAGRRVPDNGSHDAVVGMAALLEAILQAAHEKRTIAIPGAGPA